jgi:hypothetical protein
VQRRELVDGGAAIEGPEQPFVFVRRPRLARVARQRRPPALLARAGFARLDSTRRRAGWRLAFARERGRKG